jgi:gamma-glutamyltranspeptidase/glutathione hydrolase
MSPTVLISGDGERIVIGGSGGPFIISSVVQVIINMVDFGMDPSAAVSAPRIHHQWQPDILFLDEGISPDTARALQARGHTIKVMPFFSAVQVVRGRPGEAEGASDPRKGGWPAPG